MGMLSQEIWGKKKEKRPSNFDGNSLKNIFKTKYSSKSSLDNKNQVDNDLCLYCDELDVTAQWVASIIAIDGYTKYA